MCGLGSAARQAGDPSRLAAHAIGESAGDSAMDKITLICSFCHQPFQVHPCQRSRKFCSRVCYLADKETHRVVCICTFCQKPFTINLADEQRGQGIYCSQVCYHAHQRQQSQPLERFWSKVNKTDTCWLWTGAIMGRGYGNFAYPNGKSIYTRAHCFAWGLVGGSVPNGVEVCHTCDVRNCVRNDDEGTYEVNGVLLLRWGHLFLGTRKQNLQDADRKGRMVRNSGRRREALG
jgi:hypothetical protein